MELKHVTVFYIVFDIKSILCLIEVSIHVHVSSLGRVEE
jgi:hypothetical protein